MKALLSGNNTDVSILRKEGLTMCTEFAKGIAIGMIAGAAAGAMVAMPKKRGSMAGKMLKAAGHIVDSISDAVGL